jgi:hypothetical protein
MKQGSRHIVKFVFLVSLVVSASVLIFSATRSRAQSDIITDITKQLIQQGVPVKSIDVEKELPLQIKVTLQSDSESDKVMPDDPLSVQMVHRETALIRKQGFSVDTLTIIILNENGEQIFWLETPINPLNVSEQTSKLDDKTTTDLVRAKLETYGLQTDIMQISSDKSGYQILTLDLSVASLEQAKKALPQFITSLYPFLENFNKENGTQIIIAQVNLSDNNEQLLLKYGLDLQLEQENWWKADDLTNEWFPHPAPEVPPSEEP